jgi:hypothetical protein
MAKPDWGERESAAVITSWEPLILIPIPAFRRVVHLVAARLGDIADLLRELRLCLLDGLDPLHLPIYLIIEARWYRAVDMLMEGRIFGIRITVTGIRAV